MNPKDTWNQPHPGISFHPQVSQKLTLILLLFMWPLPRALGKELYMTVFRDFGIEETPTIEINYKYQSPLTLRVLKPKNMEKFIAQQIDLKRAWKMPRTEINSLRILKSGLNSLKWRTDWIRRTLNPDLRQKFSSQFGGGKFFQGTTSLDEGHKRIISLPDDFELSSEFVIYPEITDQTKPFDVPGFNHWFNSQGNEFKTKSISLPKLKPGFYLVQVTQGPLEGQVIVVINDMIAEIQQSDSEALVRVAHRNGEPLRKAKIEVRNVQGEWKLEKELNDDGTSQLSDLPSGPLIYLVSDLSNQYGAAIIDAEFLSSSIDYPDIYLFGDRPIYRPGDEINFKGIMRKSWDGLSRILGVFHDTSKDVSIQLTNTENESQGAPITSQLSSFGTFHGVLSAPKSNSGVMRILSRVDNEDHRAEVRVQEYVKPLYYLSAKSNQETLRAGQILKVDVTMARFAGGHPAQGTLRADLYRERYQLPEWIETSQLSEQGNPQTYGFDTSTSRSPAIPYPIASVENIKLDKTGHATITIEVPKEVPGDPNYDYTYRLNLYAYDETKESASHSMTFLDTRSSVIADIRNHHTYIKKGSSAQIKVVSLAPSGNQVSNVKGTVTWRLKTYSKIQKTISTTDFITDEKGAFLLDIPSQDPGEVSAEVTLSDSSGEKTTATTSTFIYDPTSPEPFTQVESLTLLSNKSVVRPQEEAEILVLLPEAWGVDRSSNGTIHVTLAGKKIYTYKQVSVFGNQISLKVNVEPRFENNFYVIISYPDPRLGWTERRMGLSVLPEDKILNISMDFSNNNISPQGEQTVFFNVKDHQGKPIAAEIALSVVDEAVYRIQEEFKPPILEFFYPRQRLNLMTFVSQYFQSYGYGESLASMFKSNFTFASPKSEKNKFDRDTAYWNPSILTREDGTAEVSFKLPTNQTMWRATAIAVDRNGSFGEIKEFFKANQQYSLITAWPRSLRNGDEVNVNMKVIASEKSVPSPFKIHFESSNLIPMSANSIFEGTIKSGEETTIPIRFKMTQLKPESSGGINASLTTQSQKSEYKHAFQTLDTEHRYHQSLDFGASNIASIPVTEGEEVENISINFAMGLSGTLNSAARSLLLYPYGCAEQLSSSLVVNFMNFKITSGQYIKEAVFENPLVAWWESIRLFFSRSLFWTKSLRKETLKGISAKASDAITQESKVFYTAALQRLKHYQNEDGSLAWWSGIGQSDLPMTLYVLYTLTSLPDLDLVTSIDLKRSWKWLERQPLSPDSSEYILRLAIYGQLVKRGVLPIPNDQHDSSSDWKFLIEKTRRMEDSSEKIRDLSWIALGLNDSAMSHTGEFRTLYPELIANIKSLFRSEVDLALVSQTNNISKHKSISYQSWPDYPGRSYSTIALAGRALQQARALSPSDRTDLIKVLSGAFDGDRFLSTFETAHILVNSEHILKFEARSLSGLFLKPEILIQGRKVPPTTLSFEPHVGGFSASLQPPSFLAGSHELRIENLQRNITPSAIAFKKIDTKKITPYFSPWPLERRVYKLNQSSTQLTPISSKEIKLGDLLFIEIQIGMDQSKSTSPYLLIEDSVASGIIPIMEDRAFTGSPWNLPLRPQIPFKRDFLIDRVRFHLQSTHRSSASKITIGYLARAAFQGSFQGGLTKVEDMYQDTHYSHISSPSVIIGGI